MRLAALTTAGRFYVYLWKDVELFENRDLEAEIQLECVKAHSLDWS